MNGFDEVGRVVKRIVNASDPDYDVDADPDLSAYTGSTPDADQDRISTTEYDLLGRVVKSIDPAGVESRTAYDVLGRTILQVRNFVDNSYDSLENWVYEDRVWKDAPDGTVISHGTDNDQNLVSQSTYDRSGQVLSTRDVRGTVTGFTYDDAGRRLTTISAQGSWLETTAYTVYDKVGRVQRSIQNYLAGNDAPEAKDSNGNWLFAPNNHGTAHDTNLIAEISYDAVGRQVARTNPAGDSSETSYFLDGRVDEQTDPEGTVTAFRYDALNRRIRVVQSYVAQATDPEAWVWDSSQWEDGNTNAIPHGTDKDENIIVDVA